MTAFAGGGRREEDGEAADRHGSLNNQNVIAVGILYLRFTVKGTRVSVPSRQTHATPLTEHSPHTCHWYMSKGHHPTPSRSGDLASDVPLLAPQAARVGLVGGGAQWTWWGE